MSSKTINSDSESSFIIKVDGKVLTIKTPGNDTMILSVENNQVTIQDENSNSIVMSENGITIQSQKDINIESEQNVNIKGQTGVNIESSAGDVSTKGLNVKMDAYMELSANGAFTTEIKSGTQLTLKSALIMIN